MFISHAWKYQFLDVLDALQNYFEPEPDIIIWFDVFSVNQHADTEVDLDFDWWSHSFKSAIRDFGRTVMVLAPWEGGQHHHRAAEVSYGRLEGVAPPVEVQVHLDGVSLTSTAAPSSPRAGSRWP